MMLKLKLAALIVFLLSVLTYGVIKDTRNNRMRVMVDRQTKVMEQLDRSEAAEKSCTEYGKFVRMESKYIEGFGCAVR